MATLTMLMSTSCMKPAISTTARAIQRRGSAPPGARPGSAVAVGLLIGAPWGEAGQQGRDQLGRRVGPVAEGERLRPGHQLDEDELLAGAQQQQGGPRPVGVPGDP